MESVDYRNFKIEIKPDPSPDNPRDWDNLGVMVCFHRRYHIGDNHGYANPTQLTRLFETGDYYYLPIYAYEHGGITISTRLEPHWPDKQWDCGQLGYIYTSKAKVRQEWKVQRISKKLRQQVMEILKTEVKIQDAYMNGRVYGYIVRDPIGEEIDSSWGFYDETDALNEAKAIVDWSYKEQEEIQRLLLDASLIPVGL